MAMAMGYSGHVDSTYLDMAAQILSAAKRRTYELIGLQVGHRVLDLGYRPASDTIALADLVGETGEVHGVDFDTEMVEEAIVRAKAAGTPAPTRRSADESTYPATLLPRITGRNDFVPREPRWVLGGSTPHRGTRQRPTSSRQRPAHSASAHISCSVFSPPRRLQTRPGSGRMLDDDARITSAP